MFVCVSVFSGFFEKTNLDWSKVSGPDYILVVVLKKYETELEDIY